jgi:hypothetical protein
MLYADLLVSGLFSLATGCLGYFQDDKLSDLCQALTGMRTLHIAILF